MNCKEFPLKSMAYIDDEMSGAQRTEFEDHIAGCDRCRSELGKLERVKQMTTRIQLADLHDREWDRHWTGIYNRLERAAGWIFLSIGAIIVLAYGVFQVMKEILADPTIPFLVRCGIGALVLGLVILFVSVARQRIAARKSDPYREVQR